MLRDDLRDMFAPPRHDEWPPADRIRAYWLYRLWFIALAQLSNLVLLVVLFRASWARPEAVRAFPFTNLLPMGVDLLLSALYLRRWSRAYPWVIASGTVLECFAMVSWIQMTGSTSSYFISSLMLGPVLSRLVYTYRIGVIALLTSMAAYVGVIVLENVGHLRFASLFENPAWAVQPASDYRFGVLVSLVSSGFLLLAGTNLFAARWRRSRIALARAQSEIRRIAEEAHLGRLSGSQLGGYALDELLGRGGMGEVYAARTEHGMEVAIKLLHPHLAADSEMRGRFRREAEALQRMPGGAVAKVLEFGTAPDGSQFIAMERLRGESLDALFRRKGKLRLDEVLELAAGMAHVLDAAHDLGIIHRDLKPQNVFLAHDPVEGVRRDCIRLLDFGIAKLQEASGAESFTATKALMGTPGYFSPEQVRGAARTPAADVFSMGSILYRALTGQRAFPSTDPAVAVLEVLQHEPRWPSALDPSIPGDVDAVLALALAKDSTRRYQRAGDVVRDLALALRGALPGEVRKRAGSLMRVQVDSPTVTATVA